MLYALAGIAAGLLLGLLLPWSVPAAWSPYLSAAILAAFAALLDGAAERMKGTFKPGLLLAAFIGDAALAGALAWLGDRLDIPLYLAAVVWFGGKVFLGFGKLRDLWAEKQRKTNQNNENEHENHRI